MQKFTKRPEIFEAVLFDGTKKSLEKIATLCDGMKKSPIKYQNGTLFVLVRRGFKRAYQGDWVIKDIDGHLYPWAPDAFQKRFQSFED